MEAFKNICGHLSFEISAMSQKTECQMVATRGLLF